MYNLLFHFHSNDSNPALRVVLWPRVMRIWIVTKMTRKKRMTRKKSTLSNLAKRRRSAPKYVTLLFLVYSHSLCAWVSILKMLVSSLSCLGTNRTHAYTFLVGPPAMTMALKEQYSTTTGPRCVPNLLGLVQPLCRFAS